MLIVRQISDTTVSSIKEPQYALNTVKGREKQTRLQLDTEIAELRATIEGLAEGSKNMNADYKRKKAEADKRFAFLLALVGFSVSCVILGTLHYLLVYAHNCVFVCPYLQPSATATDRCTADSTCPFVQGRLVVATPRHTSFTSTPTWTCGS